MTKDQVYAVLARHAGSCMDSENERSRLAHDLAKSGKHKHDYLHYIRILEAHEGSCLDESAEHATLARHIANSE